jgi:LmbE family N-acetylglucosaminyl deacetylase
MNLTNPNAEIFIPDNIPVDNALQRTTHLCVAAHQDDIEIMALHGILQCFGKSDKWFTGAVITNGSGSPRDDLYAQYTDEQMQVVRRVEQKKAAVIGEYAAQFLLDYASSDLRDPANADVVADTKAILLATRPEIVYTHNLTDKHDTHVSCALRVIRAIRELPEADRPETLYGCEVWRDLDWTVDEDKVPLDVAAHENLAAALLGVFDSQICGGKRYDLATMGRWQANATYFASHGTDDTTYLSFAMDMTPLMRDASLDPAEFALAHIRRFQDEVVHRLEKLR